MDGWSRLGSRQDVPLSIYSPIYIPSQPTWLLRDSELQKAERRLLVMVLHFSDIRCQLPPWLLLSEHNGMQFVGLDDEVSLWDHSDMVSLECKVSKQQQQRLFKLNNQFPKSCCNVLLSYTCWEDMYVYFQLFLKQTPVVCSSVYFCLTALITVFHRWCIPVIKRGPFRTALVEPSHQTDRRNSCCQHLANTQLTFFICEFSNSQTEVTLHYSLIPFER